MKRNNLCAFFCGILVTALVFGGVMAASATSGNIIFNCINLVSNGKTLFEKDNTMELPSGQIVPTSVLYVDETGGGTTYLPVRTIAELLGVPLIWDSETETVYIGETHETVAPEERLQKLAEQWLVDGDFPKNDKGETYGPELLFDIVGHMPDLVSVTATNGQDGYLRNSELEKLLSSFDAPSNSLPVYNLNGDVIGEFVFENG